MNKLTTYLKETPRDDFWEWYEDFAIRRSGLVEISNNRYKFIQPAILKDKGRLYDNRNYISIEAYEIVGTDNLYLLNSPSEIVRIEPMSIGKRLKVKIEWKDEDILLPYLIPLLVDIREDWPDTADDIQDHMSDVARDHCIDVKLIALTKEMEQQKINTGESYSTDSTDQEKNKRKPRRDAIKRAAYAFILLEDSSFRKRVNAIKRAHTTTTTMNKYEDDPDLKEMIKLFRDFPSELNKFRQEIARKYSKRNT